MAFKWFWNEKTEYYDEEINRNTDWGGDASTGGVPVSGGRVQEWLKNEINGKFGVIRISSSINENNFYSLEMFPTKEDEELYDSDNEAFADLITIVPIPISTVQGDAFTAMLRTNMSNTANIVVTDDKLEVELNYRAIKITQIGNENAGYNGSLVVQTSTNGETWNTMGTIPNCLPSSEPDDTSTITKVDIGKYLTNGRQYVRVRAQYTYENEEGVEKTVNSSNVIVGNSVTKTQLSLELRTDFQTPMSTYDQNGAMKQFSVQYNVYGAVRKTLYLEITGSAGTYTTSQSLSMDDDGTTATINVNENSSYGLLTHGVKKVKAWMEAEDGLGNKVTSNTLVNRFMMVDNKMTGDARLKPYIMLQNVDGEIVNYEQTEIAQYAVYSPKLNEDGSVTNDGEAINVAFLITNYAATGKEPTIEYLRIEQMAEPNKALSLVATVEIEPETEGSTVESYIGYFRVRRTSSVGVTDFIQESTGETNYRIDIDNTTAFTPIAGAVFFLNPKTRNNSESNPKRILNARNNNAEVGSDFKNFGFINDGWMTAEDGQKVLRIPAGATLEINWDVWAQFRKTPLSSMTFTIDYKVSNVTDLTSSIISIGDGSKGLTMNALDGWLRTASYNDKDDCLFSWQEDKRTHLAVNVHHAVKPNNGDVYYPSDAQNVNGTLPLARVLIDGVIQREIPFSTTNAGEWSTSGSKIVIGNPDADIDIYGIYVYAEKQLEVNEIQSRNVLAAKPTAEEKNAVKTRNNILTGGKIDVEKVKQLGKNCLIWHGAQPYFYNESEQKGWYEIYRYDDEGNYLPEYSGTICKATKSLEVKGQGSTAKTYYDWNQQDDISKVKYDFATENNTILVPMNDIHESIVVGAPYEGSIDEDEGKGGKYQGMVVDVYGGNLGKNYPIENKPMQYPYINGKIMFPDGWIDGNGKYRGRGYKVAENAALAQKNVNKVNYASSMQSHLIGACNSYNDLHRKVVGDTPLQKVCPTAVSAKHTEPFMVFNQVDDASPVVFRGMGNYGAGKMDKVAWGYVKKLHPMFALIEGSDNNLPMTGFRVPFDKTTAVYSPEGEGWKYADQISWDFDGGATIDNYTDGWTTDGTNNKGEVEVPSVAIRDRWADVHNFIYLLSTNLKFFDGTYEEFIKSNVAQTDTNYKYWCTQGDKAYDIFRYDFVGKAWVYSGLNGGGINIKTTAPYYSVYNVWDKEGTGDYEILNQRIIDTNVAFMRKFLKYFFNEKSLLFNYAYVIHFMTGTDNSDKNTYFKIMPYAEDFSADANTADGIEFNTWFKARFGKDFDFSNVYQVYMDGDDMDSIFRTDNNSHQKKPYYIDRVNNWNDTDATKKSLYEGLGNQLFNFVEKAYSTGHEIADMVKQIFVAMTELVDEKDKFYGNVGIKKSVWGFLHKYFFNVQHYFPEVAYNEQARIRYEFPKLLGFISSGAGARNVDPISQSLGNQLENELQYMNQRLVMMASFAGFGAFGTNHEIGIAEAKDTFSFTPAAMHDGSPSTYTFTVKTHQYLYPAYTVGGTYYNTRNRCKPNTEFTFTMQGSFASSDTGLGICGINYYTDLGSFANRSIVGDFTIVGKRLRNFHASGRWTISSYAFRATSITINTTSLKKFSAEGIPELTNVNLQACVRCSEISVAATGIKNVITPKSYNLKSLYCGSYINTKTYSLEINDAPNLEKINCVGTSAMTSLYVHPNVGTNTGLSLQSLATDIYTNQKSQSTPTLQEISIQNVNWTDFDADVLEWYCDIHTCEFKGTISIKEDDPLGLPRITWDLKNKINAKFGNVDQRGELHKGLIMNYKKRAFSPDLAQIVGDFYPEAGNEFQFSVKPNSRYENTQYSIHFSLSNGSGIANISTNGLLNVNTAILPNTEHIATVNVGISAFNDNNQAFYTYLTKPIKLWNRPAQLGDLVYYDGTYQDPDDYNGEKTPIGVCFYIGETDRADGVPDRRMVALDDIKAFDSSSSAPWGLYNGDNTNGITDITLEGILEVYDISTITNFNVTGLAPAKEENSPYYIRDDNYRDLENGDKYGFVTGLDENTGAGDIGLRELSTTMFNLAAGGIKVGEKAPSGLHHTLAIIAHRNQVLNAAGLPIPSGADEMRDLKNSISAIINTYDKRYQQYYYPAASYCYAYKPNVKSNEILSPKFQAHNWYLPAIGELVRQYWYHRQGLTSDLNVFEKAINNGVMTDYTATNHWSSSEGGQTYVWHVNFSIGSFGGNDKSGSIGVRAVCAF